MMRLRLPLRAAIEAIPDGLLCVVLAFLLVLAALLVVQWARATGVRAFPLEIPAGASRDPRTCANFTSQAAAQAAYRTDPERLRHLDADGDGLACEGLR